MTYAFCDTLPDEDWPNWHIATEGSTLCGFEADNICLGLVNDVLVDVLDDAICSSCKRRWYEIPDDERPTGYERL